jgi:hypothetical protein
MIALTPWLLAASLALPSPPPVYLAVTMRAAPGHLLELIEVMKSRLPVYRAASEPAPVLMRHAQGDQWDLLVVIPIGSIAEYFGRERELRWRAAGRRTGFDDAQFARRLDEWTAWREELYVEGPPVAEFERAAAGSGYFHLEIFQALAGRRDSLLHERVMENDFLARTGKPVNFIFKKVTGSAWDSFTIGFYRDLQHYAEPAKVSAEEEDRAARAAGFESRNHIGAYLRRFLNGHHDTIGPVVR